MEVVRQLDESAPKLPNGIHTEALALCTMLLDSGIIPLNHVDVATSTWFNGMMPAAALYTTQAPVYVSHLAILERGIQINHAHVA